jgi:hypothetical protein
MAGYLDTYGAGDEQRERRTKRIIVWGLIVVVVAGVLYFTFRNWTQERLVKQFFTLLEQKDYQGAYKLWGCSPDNPCKYYPPEKFTEDWGPSSPYAEPSAIKIAHEDSCGAGVVFTIESPKAQQPMGLYVERGTNVIGFAPWPRCPGRHLRLWEFLKSRFG